MLQVARYIHNRHYKDTDIVKDVNPAININLRKAKTKGGKVSFYRRRNDINFVYKEINASEVYPIGQISLIFSWCYV